MDRLQLFYSLKTIPNRLSRLYHSLTILFIAFKVNSQSSSDLTSRLRMTWLIISSSPGNTFKYGGFQDATLPWFSPTSPGLLF